MNAPVPSPSVRVRVDRLSLGARPLFENLRMTLPGGRWTCLLGPSGVGKSTLLRLIAGLDRGRGADIAAEDGEPLAGRVAYMAQRDLLLPWLSARDNVTLGFRLRGGPVDAATRGQADRLLARVGLDGQGDAAPGTLSGGMRQRVALARTLMEDRPVVLMDEPFASLDAITRLRLQDLAADLLTGRTVLLVTHDPLEALRLGHDLRVLSGRPAALGPPLHPPGDPPRQADDRRLLALQADLLARLAEAAS